MIPELQKNPSLDITALSDRATISRSWNSATHLHKTAFSRRCSPMHCCLKIEAFSSALCIIPSTGNSPYNIISLPARAASQYCSCSALWYSRGKPMDCSLTTWTYTTIIQRYRHKIPHLKKRQKKTRVEGLRVYPPHTIPKNYLSPCCQLFLRSVSLLETLKKHRNSPEIFDIT